MTPANLAGMAALAASPRNLADIKSRMTVQTIGHDKLNMLRHARFFKDIWNKLKKVT